MKLLVTGGSGFIGSHIVCSALERRWHVLNYDALTYAANPLTLKHLNDNPLYTFVHGNIVDLHDLDHTLQTFEPDYIIHCAAESHVDRSIDSPAIFTTTNVIGTQNVLEATLRYVQQSTCPEHFRLLSLSTDEVFGSLTNTDHPFTETSPYNPSSPYAASKASADHFVRAYAATYNLPVIISHSGNNYGPFQYPEKLIPHMIVSATRNNPLPVYGHGQNSRDWVHVTDHVDALFLLLDKGRRGKNYVISANDEWCNLDIVKHICAILDDLTPRKDKPYRDLIDFVTDRPGHDLRYASDAKKINDLGWTPKHKLETSLAKTVSWYLDHPEWIECAFEQGYTHLRQGTLKRTGS